QALIDDAKARIKGSDYAGAIDVLKTARADFPESTELRDLETFATEELAHQRQQEAVTRIISETDALAKENRFEDALQLVRNAVTEYPSSPQLRERLQSLGLAKADHERRTALRDVEENVRGCCEKGSYQQAMQSLDDFTRAYGGAPELDALRKTVEKGVQEQRAQAAMKKLIVNAQTLLDDGKPESATRLLQTATIKFPQDPELVRLLVLAEQQLQEKKIAEEISRAVSEAESLARARQFARALELLDTTLQRYPDAERLKRCREATVAIEARHVRDQRGQQALQKAQDLRRAGKHDDALAEIDSALLGGSEYLELRSFRDEVDRERTQIAASARQKAELLSRVLELKRSGKIAAALELLRAGWDTVSADQQFVTLRKELETELTAARQEEEFRRFLERANALMDAGQAEEAVALLEGAKEYAGKDSVVELLKRAREQITSRERGRAIAESESRIRRLVQSGEMNAALWAADQALEKFPGVQPLAELRRSIAMSAQRSKAIQEVSADTEALLQKGQPAEALARVTPVQAKYADDAQLASLRRKAELHSYAAQADAMLASGQPETALQIAEQHLVREKGFEGLVARLRSEVELRRKEVVIGQARARLAALQQTLVSTSRRKLPAIASEARMIAALHGDVADLQEAAARIGQSVEAALAATQPKPVNWRKWIRASAIAVPVLVIGTLAAWLLRSNRSEPAASPVKPIAPQSYVLQVRTDPEGAAVRVRGQDPICRAATCSFDLPAGDYTVHAERAGYQAADRTVRLGPGLQTGLITISLEPVAPTAPDTSVQTGLVLVRTAPGARVLVDNEPKGLTNARGELSATIEIGKHEVRVEKAGYRASQPKFVDLTAGITRRLQFDLVQEPGKVEIRGAPAGVRVSLGDGSAVVTTGSTVSIPSAPGDQKLRVTDANGTKETAVHVEPGGTSTVDWNSVAPPKPVVVAPPPKQVPVAPPPPVPTGPTPARLEAQAWERAKASGEPSTIEKFLKEHPNASAAGEARALLEQLIWAKTNPANVQ
ncbi:MAG: PEGA domain-containing protein, partial [Acidobacteriaceae bacterium]|nr:PEGA domain-containing protein [Acidobacteriaceae bacterium]